MVLYPSNKTSQKDIKIRIDTNSQFFFHTSSYITLRLPVLPHSGARRTCECARKLTAEWKRDAHILDGELAGVIHATAKFHARSRSSRSPISLQEGLLLV